MYKLIISLSVLLFGLLVGCSSTPQDEYKDLSAVQIYELGQKHLAKEDYHGSIKDFEALEARYPYGDYAVKGEISLIYSYYKKKESVMAIAAADRFIKMHPDHPEIDYVTYLKGLSHYSDNLSFMYRRFAVDRALRDPTAARQSFDTFKKLLIRFPQSKYAADARQRMIKLKNQLARHELHVAELYMKRKAYLAAANRASHIVSYYETSQSVPAALKLLATAYNNLGMKNLEKDALKILGTNFPSYKG